MVMLPAICDGCGASAPSGFEISNCNAHFIGNTCGTCHECGGVMRILDGHFNITDKAIEILFAPQRTYDELKKLDLIIRESSKQNLSPEQVAEKIKIEIPTLSIFANFIPKNKGEWLNFVYGLIIPCILYAIQNQPIQQNTTINNINVYAPTVNQYLISPKKNEIDTIKDRFLKFKFPEVNDPCYCGSGKKYKKCCKQ